jgi:hypothetical protein
MPKYTTFEAVRVRLLGKVRFTEDENDENKFQKQLAVVLIDEAEGQVEQDLSPRFHAPFMHKTIGTFDALPQDPTKTIIQTLAKLQACIRVLETDFGSGSAVEAEKYISSLRRRYKEIVEGRILAKYDNDYKSSRQWKFPPLPELKKAYFNQEADDGWAGIGPLVTSESDGDFPAGQINDPAESWFTGLNW